MADERIIQQVIRRHDTLQSVRKSWETHWNEVSEYVIPRHNIYTKTRGGKRNTTIYDSTAPRACARLAASLHSMLTNPSQDWIALRVMPETLMDAIEVRRWLYKTEEAILTEINNSNFHAKAQEFYLDLVAFGTGILFADESPTGSPSNVTFYCLPINQCGIAENSYGRIDVLHREFNMSARNIVQKFGEKACNKEILEIAEKRPDSEVTIIHAIFPKEDYNKYNKFDKPYVSLWIAKKWNHVLREGGYYEFPAFVTRWATASGEIWGRGPGMEALADIKTANKMTKDILDATSRIITPPLDMEYQSYLTPLDITPGRLNQRAKNANPVQPLYTVDGRAIPVTDNLLEKIKASINETFYFDAISLIKADRMTATEVMQRVEENMRILGPTYSRLVHEYLEPLTKRVYGILLRKGILPEPPQILQRYRGKMKIDYMSPMARAQKTSDVAAIQRTINMLAAMAQIQPEVLDNFDFDIAARYTADATGVPSILIRSHEAVAAIRDARAQQQQAMQQMQAMKEAAEVGKTLSEIQM